MIPPLPPQEDWQLTVAQQFSVESLTREIPNMSTEQVQQTVKAIYEGHLRYQNLVREMAKTICTLSIEGVCSTQEIHYGSSQTTEISPETE